VSRYRIRAHRVLDGGTIESLDTEEVLGDEIRRTHATRDEADEVVEEMMGEREDYDLGEDVEYTVEEIPGDLCACGCGEVTTRTVARLREQDRGTAEALGWAEMSIATLRWPFACCAGHEDDIAGVVDESVEDTVEDIEAECLDCGLVRVRSTQRAVDRCSRCHGHDVRSLPDREVAL
jgi:hypothetical protein